MKPIGRVCNKHGFIFGGVCDKCRSEKIDKVLNKGLIQRIKIWLKYLKNVKLKVKSFLLENYSNC